MEISLLRAELADGQELYEMQLRSFRSLLEKYQDYETSPAAEKLEKTLARLQEENTDFYFILADGQKAGAVRIRQIEEGCRLSEIFLLPEYQGKGYAQRAIQTVEARYPQAGYWYLDTIKQEAKLCHLYEKMGYRQNGEEQQVKDGMTLVVYEKIRS